MAASTNNLASDSLPDNSTVLSGDEEVSIGAISDDDDEIIGSITSAALAALSFQEGQQRPHSALDSAMSGRHRNMSGPAKTGQSGSK